MDSIILEDALPESLNSIKIFILFDSVIWILGLSLKKKKNYPKERMSFLLKDVHQSIFKHIEETIN